jgi:hypothetical protein
MNEEYYEAEAVEEEYEDDFAEDVAYVPQQYAKPKSDVWTLLLVLGFMFILSAMVIMCVELNDVYQIKPEKILSNLFG